jgi:pimeloyl-ACP methyl ester carboxylesterase
VGEVRHRMVDVGGLRVHLAEQGQGPLTLLLHGFPECWYSWRHQFAPLAAAGHHVVAPDQRGYARTARPGAVEDYTILHLAGDVVGLLDVLGAERAVIVGHDWGAVVAWTVAQLRPDLVAGVVGLSVPPAVRGTRSPLSLRRAALGERFYQVYFQRPGAADEEFAADPAATFRTLLYSASGDSPLTDPPRPWATGEAGTLLDTMVDPARLPSWLGAEDIDVFVREYSAGTGAFTGGLNYYRNLDRNWALLAPFAGVGITVPAAFVTGDRDLVTKFPGVESLLPALSSVLPDLRHKVTLPGCGHWIQQERPDEVNAVLLDFLRSV